MDEFSTSIATLLGDLYEVREVLYALALVAFAHRAIRYLRAMNTVVKRELVNGDNADAEEYVGFRDEVAARLQKGSEWMVEHAEAPASEAHGRRRPA